MKDGGLLLWNAIAICEMFKTSWQQEQPEGSEDLSGQLQGKPEGPQPTESKDDAEAGRDFWSI